MIEITSKDNNIIKKIIKLNKSSKARKESGLFVAEGIRLCSDAVNSGACIEAVLFTQSAYAKHGNVVDNIINSSNNCYLISDKLFSFITDTKTPQGVLCLIKKLDKPTVFDKIKDNGKFLALENIQDPSNLGTIFRTAEAIGVDGIIMTNDCCDIYSPKVVRGTMGAIFRIPYILTDSIPIFISQHRDINYFAAVVDKSAKPISQLSFNTPCVAVIGNEGNGLKEETVDMCNVKFTIPMIGRAESLNASVAAGIILWEMIK